MSLRRNKKENPVSAHHRELDRALAKERMQLSRLATLQREARITAARIEAEVGRKNNA